MFVGLDSTLYVVMSGSGGGFVAYPRSCVRACCKSSGKFGVTQGKIYNMGASHDAHFLAVYYQIWGTSKHIFSHYTRAERPKLQTYTMLTYMKFNTVWEEVYVHILCTAHIRSSFLIAQ